MSRASTNFASRGMFDVLGDDVDEVDQVEEEEEDIESSDATSNSSETSGKLTKSARKRLAKANRLAASSSKQASGTVENVKQSLPSIEEVKQKATEVAITAQRTADQVANGAKETVSAAVNGSPTLSNVVNDLHETIDGSAVVEDEEHVPLTKASSSGHKGESSPKVIGSSFIPPAPSVHVFATNGERKSSFSQPPSTKFAPQLPEDLPEPKSNGLPSNRKRTVPDDFTPSGPRADTPGSPSKMALKVHDEKKSVSTGRRVSGTEGAKGVKFEDGLSPGQGKDGETIIKKPNQNVVERTVMTFVMIFGFILLLCAGHPFMIMLVLVCQTLVYKEVTALFELRDAGTKKTGEGDKWSKTLNWYFFVITNFFLYGESIIYYFKHIIFVDAYFVPFAKNHRFFSFMLYVVGFVGFVGNLNKQYLRQQFALFCWVHITLLLIVVSSHFIVNNILEGLIWFFVPASLVICNDVMAYICGKLFGRTPLIKLSPKKTVEGFVGAFFCTLIFAFAWGTFFMRFNYMICPAHDLGTNVFSDVTCKANPVFQWTEYEFTGAARHLLTAVLGHPPAAIPYAPFQIHCLVMATFASLVAPFGGFFASGFKRAFNIKDFGHSIPGHGGMTDRMDCQFMMGLFSYVYYSSLIRVQNVSVGSILQVIAENLSYEDQKQLLADLRGLVASKKSIAS